MYSAFAAAAPAADPVAAPVPDDAGGPGYGGGGPGYGGPGYGPREL
jgi:hypothetical protein